MGDGCYNLIIPKDYLSQIDFDYYTIEMDGSVLHLFTKRLSDLEIGLKILLPLSAFMLGSALCILTIIAKK